MQQAGLFVRNAHHLRLVRVEVTNQRGPAFDIADSSGIEISSCSTPLPDDGHPVIRLKNVDGAFIHACRAPSETSVFLRIEGNKTCNLTLSGSSLAPGAVQFGEDVTPEIVKLTSS